MRKDSKKDLVILGIDPSLRSTGWAEYDTDYPEEYQSGSIQCKKLKGVERLDYMRLQLALLLDRTKPDLVVYEDYSFGSKNRAHATGELGGIYRLWFYTSGYPVLYVPPKSLKLYITGNGNASKEDMIGTIKKRCGVTNGLSDDEADALGLVLIGRAYSKDTRPRSNKAKETLKKCVYVQGK